MRVFTCGFHHHTLFLLQKQKLRAHELSRVVGPLCRGFDSFRLSALSKAAKLATKGNSSALRLCFAQGTTLDRFPRLLHLFTLVVLGDFLSFFPLFALFHYKNTSFYLKEPQEWSTLIFADSLRA